MSAERGRVPRSAARRCLPGVAWAASLAVSATLMAVALASPAYWWLGWVTLLPLFLSIRLLQPSAAAACGAFWGASLYVVSHVVGDATIPHTIYSLALLTAVPAIYTCVGAIVTLRKGFHPLLLGLGWAGVELALHPLALRHGLLAATQGNSLWFVAIGKMGGYVLVAFLVAVVNAALLSLLSGVRLAIPRPRVVAAPPDTSSLLPLLEDLVFSFRFLEPIQPRPPPS